MADDYTGPSHEKKDQFDPPMPAKKDARKKIRPTYSCLNCHKRKVKCDRVKPCGACCLRGTPSECEYGSSKLDRHYIEQSVLIENLMHSCETLRQQVENVQREANLPAVKNEGSSSPSPPHGLSFLDTESSADNDQTEIPVDTGAQAEYQRKRIGEPSDTPTKMASSSMPLVKADQTPQALQREKRKLSDPMQARVLIEMIVERLISEFSPVTASNCGGTILLRQAAEMRVFSPMLCNAFEAASLTFTGSRQRIRHIEMAGHARYLRVLRQLQNAVYHPQKGQSTDVLTVVLLSTIIEAFKQSSKDSILKHQLGGLQLLQSRTPYRHRYGLERSLFVDLRLYWVTAAISQRKPTFLASREWLTIPWLGDNPSKDILHRVLDIAVDIPEYLSWVDNFSSMLKTATSSSSELISLQTTIWEKATELEARLKLWENMCVRPYPGGGPWEEVNPSPIDGYPVFKCRDPNRLNAFIPRNLMYPDILLATSMCFFWAMRLMISSTTDGGLPTVLTMQERYESACNICRSMKYYLQNIPGSLVSRMMFVLQTAYESLADGTIEKKFVMDLFLYIGRKFGFPAISNQGTSTRVASEAD